MPKCAHTIHSYIYICNLRDGRFPHTHNAQTDRKFPANNFELSLAVIPSIIHIKYIIFYQIAIIHFTRLQTRELKIEYKRRDVIMKFIEVRNSRIDPRIFYTKDQTDMKLGSWVLLIYVESSQ